jgi:hypothetical protein
VKAVREFRGYIEANQNFIPNYGDRYRHGEKISTAFAESAVNQVVSKRMVKKQQMRWSESGAHNLAIFAQPLKKVKFVVFRTDWLRCATA